MAEPIEENYVTFVALARSWYISQASPLGAGGGHPRPGLTSDVGWVRTTGLSNVGGIVN
jgi:hypothetical protein